MVLVLVIRWKIINRHMRGAPGDSDFFSQGTLHKKSSTVVKCPAFVRKRGEGWDVGSNSKSFECPVSLTVRIDRKLISLIPVEYFCCKGPESNLKNINKENLDMIQAWQLHHKLNVIAWSVNQWINVNTLTKLPADPDNVKMNGKKYIFIKRDDKKKGMSCIRVHKCLWFAITSSLHNYQHASSLLHSQIEQSWVALSE